MTDYPKIIVWSTCVAFCLAFWTYIIALFIWAVR